MADQTPTSPPKWAQELAGQFHLVYATGQGPDYIAAVLQRISDLSLTIVAPYVVGGNTIGFVCST